MSDEEDEIFATCGNCASDITVEEYNRTGVDEYCESCPELDTDPRSMAFGETWHSDD